MKLVTAIIKPFKLDDVRSALSEIGVQGVESLQESGEEFLLLDCREQNEYDHVRIEGSKLLPMNETPTRLSELEPHREGRIVVHCHQGMSRSPAVAAAISEALEGDAAFWFERRIPNSSPTSGAARGRPSWSRTARPWPRSRQRVRTACS